MFKKLLEIDSEINDDDSTIEDAVEVNEEEVIKSFGTYPSERLADLVISYRYLGANKNLSLAAMQELSKRRVSGDNFVYESYIDKNLKELPVITFEIKDISGIMDKLKRMKKHVK